MWLFTCNKCMHLLFKKEENLKKKDTAWGVAKWSMKIFKFIWLQPIESLRNDDSDSNKNGNKPIGLDWLITFLHVYHTFLYISLHEPCWYTYLWFHIHYKRLLVNWLTSLIFFSAYFAYRWSGGIFLLHCRRLFHI